MSTKLASTYRQKKGPLGAGKGGRGPVVDPHRARGLSNSQTSLPNSSQEDEERLEQSARILHDFDLTGKFGPCTGLTRMQRWERAHKLGLNPPQAVRDALLQAGPGSELDLNVWHGLV